MGFHRPYLECLYKRPPEKSVRSHYEGSERSSANPQNKTPINQKRFIRATKTYIPAVLILRRIQSDHRHISNHLCTVHGSPWDGEAVALLQDHLMAFHSYAESTRENGVDFVDAVRVLRKKSLGRIYITGHMISALLQFRPHRRF